MNFIRMSFKTLNRMFMIYTGYNTARVMGETLNSSGGGVTNECDRGQLAEKG
jgi:hypothetical protein